MVVCRLRWSLIELAFNASCHLMAMVAVLQAGLLLSIEVVLIASLLLSFLLYLCERSQTYFRLSRASLLSRKPKLQLAQDFARIDYRGDLYETSLPVVIYNSEFLLVLQLRNAGGGAVNTIPLVLWPDSLDRGEDRRLRRYLRFELGSDLHED
ncbi:MAG: protein YgfX [Pseudohongiellaceae bacterium]